ncbi:alcohol dehydrogenase [Halobacteriales archaeon QS_3_64_16]|nr:MAG: alcohol dehydrogenase [Halobacteriales archaeon QS_3_64_16]
MQTAVLTDSLEFEFEERERPDPGPEEVLVAIESVGICGSDVHYYRHGRIGEYVVEAPLVLGHESAGEVIAVGEHVTEHDPGDCVTLEPGVPCRRCKYCKRGEYNLCPEVTFMATPPDDGAFAEYLAWPADFAYTLPETVSTRAGALCEPLSVGIQACRRGSVGVGDSVLVSGGGPIGLLAMAAARAAGTSEILLSDVVDRKLEFAAERGADRVVDAREEDLAETVATATDGHGVDTVIEASGAPSAIRSSVEVVRRGGDVVLIGLPGDGEIPIDVLDIIDNELDIHGSFRYANTYPAAIALLESGAIDVEGVIDFEAGLSEVEDAFGRAMDEETVKGMIAIGD